MKNPKLFGHLITLLTVFIWGTTYISTKLLLPDLDPVEILLYRFIIGYLTLFLLYPKFHKAENRRDEFTFFLLGFTGVTIYFLLENFALQYTLATNVGLLTATVPLFTAIAAHYFTQDEKFSPKLLWGFLIAIPGVALVIFNGQVILKLNPLGDFLALLAPLVWGVYTILLRRLGPRYPILVTTRKTFFYGLLTLFPAAWLFGADLQPASVSLGLIGNILFLSLLASALCYVLWGKSIELIGPVRASNYIYLVPLITMITSVLVLHETVNVFTIGGGLLILIGVYVSERGFSLPLRKQKKAIKKGPV